MRRVIIAGLVLLALTLISSLAFAADISADKIPIVQYTVLAAGLAIGLGAIGSGVGMGHAISGALEGISRNPETGGRLLTTMLIGLAMIESITIYALVVALILLLSNPYI